MDDFIKMLPYSILTGPADIFYSYSAFNSAVVSLISVWVLGSKGNFFLVDTVLGSGSKGFSCFPSLITFFIIGS